MDRYAKIKEKFPELFHKDFYFECGPGWADLIEVLCNELQDIGIREGFEFSKDEPLVNQVKEKFGTLRFYVSSATDAMYDAIEKFEKLSEETCENCGKYGILREIRRWYFTRCDACFKVMQDEIMSRPLPLA